MVAGFAAISLRHGVHANDTVSTIFGVRASFCPVDEIEKVSRINLFLTSPLPLKLVNVATRVGRK